MSAQNNRGLYRRKHTDERSRSFDQSAISDDDDEESDTLTELSRESLTSSQGRSSIGSIPWAEDAIKQNQNEWERIDRMFYGEEDLPSDAKLREEILEWTSVFPFLRVTGKPITILESVHAKGNDPFHEEIFMVDPPLPGRTRSSRSGRDGPNKYPVKDVECVLTSCELDKCLCISSGQLYRQSNQASAQTKAGRRSGTDLGPVSEVIDRIDKPYIKVKPLNSLMVPQVPVVSVGSFGLLISNHYVGTGSYHALPSVSRNCSAQSVTHNNIEGSNNAGRSRNVNLQRKLAPLPHRPSQQQQHQNKSSKAIETTILSASASATHNRIPPLTKNYKFLVQNSYVAPTLLAEIEQRHHNKLNVVKSATTRYMTSSPTKHIFALPALTGIDGLVRHNPVTGASGLQPSPVKSRAFRSEVIGRSISAAVTQKQNPI
ncbi:uncharacterized protein LOC125762410 [Anopheles funestus]|uniref:uncharacterized protein LOC125762410 n=1 Tax=Anopheles funestus TaxID=62324 RepID=UPI0020C5E6E6|nr:uncharacterized protein LOC125762410 [Anopheles funestus]